MNLQTKNLAYKVTFLLGFVEIKSIYGSCRDFGLGPSSQTLLKGHGHCFKGGPLVEIQPIKISRKW